MLPTFTLALVALASATRAQQIGTFTTEQHPELNWSSCTKAGCSSVKGSAVLDSEFRWIHNVNGTNNCYLGQGFNSTLCPDGDTCAKNCAIEGVDYSKTYGVTSTGSDLTLKYVTGSNVGSRLYLLDPSDAKYQLFKLKNKEFTFDVDVSTLACGLNGALYFVEMDAEGGKSPNNKAGPRYGTGYCDAQCPTGLKFVNGKGNVEAKGACCNEMDIWEANSQATAYTPHPCDTGSTGLRTCTGDECNQVCDKGGCDYNTFRLGRKSFYGTDLAVDTTKRMTVVTQFLTNDGTDSGTLNEIRRLYVQDGKVIQNAKTNIPGIPTYDSITTQFCKDEKMAFGDTGSDPFEQYGGFNQLDKTFERGHVLALSLWDDLGSNMLWLDGEKWPLDADPLKPGVAKGNCSVTGPTAAELRKSIPDAFVTFANIKFGDIGTTFKGTPVDPAPSSSAPGSSVPSSSTPISSASSASSTTSSTPTSVATQALYHQCGGVNWTGPTVCTSTATCVKQNDWYFQCLPK